MKDVHRDQHYDPECVYDQRHNDPITTFATPLSYPCTMPVRRSSASGASPLAPSMSRSRETTSDLYGLSEAGSVLGRPEGTGGEHKVIYTMVSRIVNKVGIPIPKRFLADDVPQLPCNSGTRLTVLEEDTGVQATVRALLQMAALHLGGVIHALVTALDTLLRIRNPQTPTSINDFPLEVIQSQTYLLHVLSRCLSQHWCQQTRPQPPAELPKLWPDPQPLDESLAKYTVTVTLSYIRLVSIDMPGHGTSSPAPSRETRNVGVASAASWPRSLSAGVNSSGLGLDFIRQHTIPSGSTAPSPLPTRKVASLCGSSYTCASQMTSCVAQIVFHLSASNWPTLLARLKSRLAYLTTTIDENPDQAEFRLLEWSNMDRIRLSQVLQEISSTFLHIKRPSQMVVATTLRRAIWSFIECHQIEFQGLIRSDRKIEGGAEILFDVLQSMSDISSSSAARRTKVFYPLMAMLLVLCPDMLKRLAMGEMGSRSTGLLAKKQNFLESLRKGLNASKAFEACLVCYVDLVSAATRVSPSLESSGIRSLAPDIQNDLKVSLDTRGNVAHPSRAPFSVLKVRTRSAIRPLLSMALRLCISLIQPMSLPQSYLPC